MALPRISIPLRGTILIVDDDPSVLETLLMLLRHAGHDCRGAVSGAEAITLLRAEPFDLVITDFNLNDERGTGLDLIDRVVEHDDAIPIILVTAFPSIRTAVDAIKRGAVEFLSKPFDFEQLVHLVSRSLQERRLRMENQRLQAEVNKATVIEKLNRELNKSIVEVTRLYTISEGLSEYLETGALFERIVNLSAAVTGARRVSVMMLDKSRKHLKVRAALGMNPSVVKNSRQSLGEGIAGQVARSGEPVRMAENQIERGPRPSPPAATATANGVGGERRYETNSWLSVPLIVGRELLGVVNLTDKMDGSDFTRDDEQIMVNLIEKAAMKLENQALYEGIYSNLIDTLNALVTTIEAKDPYTSEHSERVTEYSLHLARHLGLGADQVEMLRFAGVLHDIGKIGVSDEILLKSGPLTDAEYAAIKLHPMIGDKIVAPLGLVREEQSIIRHHHERYDGQGYPDGLAGEEIPILARILAVADAFDAMTTTRSYRRARPAREALQEMLRCAGTQFDARIVKALKELVETDRITVPAPIIELAVEADAGA